MITRVDQRSRRSPWSVSPLSSLVVGGSYYTIVEICLFLGTFNSHVRVCQDAPSNAELFHRIFGCSVLWRMALAIITIIYCEDDDARVIETYCSLAPGRGDTHTQREREREREREKLGTSTSPFPTFLASPTYHQRMKGGCVAVTTAVVGVAFSQCGLPLEPV